jgi:cytochrome c biogenesis factor
MLKFFLSIKTYLWVSGLGMGIFLIGSFYIPQNLAIFSGINDMPLMNWLSINNSVIDKLLWIYVLIGIMLLLWICTLICSLDAIIKRTTRKSFIRVLSPQVLHIGILLVILGHGVSTMTGYKHDLPMKATDSYEAKGFNVKINDMDFFKNPGENSTRWRAQLEIDGNIHMLEVGKPVFYNSVGFFAKSAQEKKKTAIIGLIYDPGVIWEIIGAFVFIIGAAGVFHTKFNERLPSGIK